MGSTTDRDGTDEYVGISLILYASGDSSDGEILQLREYESSVSAYDEGRYGTNAFNFTATSEECYLVLTMYESD